MKKLIIKTFIFIVGIPFVYLLLYISVDFYYNYASDKNAIYIWGDSQTYQGIDIQTLTDSTKINTFTYAKHGAGVYDFLVFANRVPNQSTIILGVSKPVQIRDKNLDRNISGLSISALINLYKNGYNSQELLTIIKKNIKPSRIRQKVASMYKYNDIIVLGEPIALFEKIYNKVPYYLYDKQNLYKIGIKKLRSKQCNIIFVDFPYHHLLNDIEDESLIKAKTSDFSNWIIISSKKIEIDTLVLNRNNQVMHDLTHLNEFGAEQVSLYISKKIGKYDRTTMHIKHTAIDCSFESYVFIK